MNWKEELTWLIAGHEANILVEISLDNQKPLRHESREALHTFVSEIIEKLIEECLPNYERYTAVDELKQQLRDKWLIN